MKTIRFARTKPVRLLVLFSFTSILYTVVATADDGVSPINADGEAQPANASAQPVPDTSLYDEVVDTQGFFYSPYYQTDPSKHIKQQYQISLDLTQSDGNTPETDVGVTLRHELTYHTFVNRIKVLADVDETGGGNTPVVVNKRDYLLKDVLEWHFNKSTYVFAGGYWEQNVPWGYEGKYGGKSGLGTYLIQNDTTVVRLEGGFHHVTEDYIDPYSAARIDSWLMASEINWNISENTSLQAEVDALQAIDDGRDFRFMTDVTLNVNVIGKFGVMIEHKIAYDRKPVPGYKATDMTLTVSFTYGM